MDQPRVSHAKSTVSNASVGLNSDKIDEMNLPNALFKFLAGKKEAPIPKRTVGGCSTMRERILQVSLFPDIYDKRGKGVYGNSARD
jgi:hypothetical protein